MPVLPGTSVQLTFFNFPSQHPPLYYAANEGTLTLASVNAGNSDGLTVGLGGVNGQFAIDLTAAGQKHVDQYQSRHHQLLTQSATQQVWPVDDPCVFTLVQNTPVTQKPGWYEGVCFVDVFAPGLRPNGNPLNAAMLYAAPPCDSNHANAQDFLQAIAATATNIIAAIAAYNAAAAAQNLPVIEALRNTLYSSVIYNQNLNVPEDDIAGAILAGFAAGLHLHPSCGLRELQFPVGSLPGQDPLFASLQKAMPGAGALPVMALPFEGEEEGEGYGEDDPNEVEMDNLATDVDGKTLKVNAGKLADAATAVQKAIAGLDAILQAGNPLPANSPYQQAPLGAQYESTSAALGGDNPQLVAIRQPALSRPVEATIAGQTARIIVDAAARVRTLVQNAVLAGDDLKALSAARQAIDAEAATAAGNADLAEHAANQALNDNNANPALEREGATIAHRAEKAIRDAKDAVRRYERVKIRQAQLIKAQRAKVAKAVGGVVTGLIGIGSLIWIFLFSGARKIVKHGVGAFWANPITPDPIPDTQADIELDLPALNGELALIKAAHLLDDKGNQIQSLDLTEGKWEVVKSTHVKYTPKTRTKPAVINYVLEAEGTPGAISDPAAITISYLPPGKVDPTKPVDLIELATDRTSAVRITAPATFEFVGTPSDAEGAWSFDSTGPAVVFTPKSGVTLTGLQKTTLYRLSGGDDTAQVAFILPAPALTKTAPNRGSFDFDALGAPVKLTGNLMPAEGAWSITSTGQIRFTPGSGLPATASSVKISYTFTLHGKDATAGTAQIDYPAAGTAPTSVNAVHFTANRTGAVVFNVANAQLAGPANDPNGQGVWSVTPTQVTFQPSLQGAGQVSVSVAYVIVEGGLTSNQSTLSITFLPTPATVSRTKVSRAAGLTLDIKQENAAITTFFSVKLWNGSAALDSFTAASGARWAVSGTNIGFTPPAMPTGVSESIQYVLVAPDQTLTAPAAIQLDYDPKPFVRPITVTSSMRYSIVDVPFLANTILPGGYQDVRSTQFGVDNSGAIWNKATDAGGQPILRLDARNSPLPVITLTFTVVDKNGLESDPATVTVDFTRTGRFQPRAADCLVAKAPAAGAGLGADVLASSSSTWPADPKSVVLTGLLDLGQDTPLPNGALLQKDGKALHVPGEGVWLVDDSGKIGFQADPALTGAPTPIGYRFADTRGNLSNPAAFVFDPGLTDALGLPAQMAALDDTAFWKAFQQHVSRPLPALDSAEFITVCALLAGITLASGAPGPNPVTADASDQAYQAWDAGGQIWDDSVGTPQPTGLFTICAKLVDGALPKGAPANASRYWRLEIMTRLAQQALP